MYNKGNFYTNNLGNHVLDNYNIENSILNGCAIGGCDLLTGATVPTVSVLASTGSLYICTATGSVGLYINTGTATTPVWKAVTLQS